MQFVTRWKRGSSAAAVASVCLCFGTIMQFGCANDADRVATTTPVKMTDGELEQAIKTRLNADASLTDVKVSANADKSEVTLSGNVETQDQRARAVTAAKAVNSALVITDKIDVKPREIERSAYTDEMARERRQAAKARGETVGDSVDDAWIHTKIATKLMTDKDTPARKINIDVKNNVVTLRGFVDNVTAKAEADRIAKETDGVKRVNNLLKVQPNS